MGSNSLHKAHFVNLKAYHQQDIFDSCQLWQVGYTDHTYHQTSNIKCTLVGNKIIDHSDVVGAVPVDAAPTTSSFST